MIGHPVAQVESVVFVTDAGNLVSFSSGGTALWSYNARGRLTPHVSRSREGTSYICRTNGTLIAVNRSGRELWQLNIGSPIITPVLIGWDGRLFVFTEREVICLTAAGYRLWSRRLEQRIALTPFLDKTGGVILVLEDGEVLSLDPFGNAVYYRQLPGVLRDAPVAAASLKIDGWGHSLLMLYPDRQLELIYPALGYGVSLRGILELPAPPLAAVGRNDEAAVLLTDGRVALLSLGRRQILWTSASHIQAGELSQRAGALDSGPKNLDFFYDERGIFILTRTGATSFASDGRVLWTKRLSGAAAIPAFGDDGILYSGSTDWVLSAWRLEERVRAQQRVLFGEAAPGSYGTGNPPPSSWANYHFRFHEDSLEERFAEIRYAVRNGNIGSNEKEYVAWLMETAGSRMFNPWVGNLPLVHTRHRAEAARLLAFMGSRETIPFLADLFRRDPDPPVRAAAAEAIGRIGVDPEGIALRAFQGEILPPFPSMDEAVVSAVAAAIGALCRFSGPPLSQTGIRLLTHISANDRLPVARNQAQRELRSLASRP